jgi:hypothetical protein
MSKKREQEKQKQAIQQIDEDGEEVKGDGMTSSPNKRSPNKTNRKENTADKSFDIEQGYGSHEEGLSPRPAEEKDSDSSGYSDEEAEIFEKLNQSRARAAVAMPT